MVNIFNPNFLIINKKKQTYIRTTHYKKKTVFFHELFIINFFFNKILSSKISVKNKFVRLVLSTKIVVLDIHGIKLGGS